MKETGKGFTCPGDRIILPREVRAALGWEEKTPVEIWFNTAQEEIVIRQHKIRCLFCGEGQNLKRFHEKWICAACKKNDGGLGKSPRCITAPRGSVPCVYI